MAKGDPPPRNPVVAKALEKVQLAQDVALVRSAMQGAGGQAMPADSKVGKMYDAMRKEGMDPGKAARISQAQTGLALATGKPPKTSAHNHSSGALAMIRKKREERGEKTKDRETGKGEP